MRSSRSANRSTSPCMTISSLVVMVSRASKGCSSSETGGVQDRRATAWSGWACALFRSSNPGAAGERRSAICHDGASDSADRRPSHWLCGSRPNKENMFRSFEAKASFRAEVRLRDAKSLWSAWRIGRSLLFSLFRIGCGLDHDDFGLNQSKIIVIDSKSIERDAVFLIPL